MFSIKCAEERASLVVQWLKIRLLMQGTHVHSGQGRSHPTPTKPGGITAEASCCRACVGMRSHPSENAHAQQLESSSCSTQLRKAHTRSSEDRGSPK